MGIIRNKKIFLSIAAAIVLTAGAVVAVFGIKPGIDFTGGSLMEVRYGTLPEKSEVETVVGELNLGNTSVRHSESEAGSGYLVTTRDLSDEERASLETKLTSIGAEAELVRFTSIGPVIGQELADKAWWAIGAVLGLIIIYVAFAFAGVGAPVSSWVYGFMTIIVLGHDILVPLAFISFMGEFFGTEADILFVTVLLTILGFSVNDTIVIFDRIREKLKLNRTETRKNIPVTGGKDEIKITYTLHKPFSELVGQAIDETMVRSINTSLTVLIALIALYIFGSSVTQMFTLSLMVGIVAGAYSSIFIASPLLVLYQEWQEKKQNSK
ncbi:MAG: protein translocase subunit SecF [Candidatus Pacebacteria bacterium]|nr:protein translocase subunit SecF [Candidatus Paceibacterota bacterium]MBP9842911.1 protein translocase subunit SecF [Candidatus Paceibacterota bacterium]